MGDDFCIDEDAGVIYLATHRQNTIDRVSMDPGHNSGFTESVVGDPFTKELMGPSSGAWGRALGEYGRVAYFITDGGTHRRRRTGGLACKAPACGVVGRARIGPAWFGSGRWVAP